jgi:hypothetical protein
MVKINKGTNKSINKFLKISKTKNFNFPPYTLRSLVEAEKLSVLHGCQFCLNHGVIG